MGAQPVSASLSFLAPRFRLLHDKGLDSIAVHLDIHLLSYAQFHSLTDHAGRTSDTDPPPGGVTGGSRDTGAVPLGHPANLTTPIRALVPGPATDGLSEYSASAP